MKKTKVMSAKRSLVMSVLSLILCFAMLIGTTWAWFTDSVTSGANRIVAGNLDVKLWHTSKTVTSEQEIRNGDANLLFKDVTFWEPGAYCYETFKVENVGNLALKYKMNLNVVGKNDLNGHDLTEVIKVAVSDAIPVDREAAAALDGYTSLENWMLNKDNVSVAAHESDTFTVVLYWQPTDNDNQWNLNNGKHTDEYEIGDEEALYIDLGVNLYATQVESESDSFGTDYDKAAALPVNSVAYGNLKVTDDSTKTDAVVNTVQTIDDGVMSVTYPDGVKLANNGEVTGSTEKKTPVQQKLEYIGTTPSGAMTTHSVTIGADKAVAQYELTLPVANENTVPVTVTINYTPGLSGVKIYHSGEELTATANDDGESATYNATTGDLTLTLNHASPIDIVYDAVARTDAPVATVTKNGVETKFYASDYEAEATEWTQDDEKKEYGPFNAEYVALCHAFYAASNGLGDVETKIVIGKDIKPEGNCFSDIFSSDTENGYGIAYVAAIPNVTLDLNGHKIEMNATSESGSAICVYNANLTVIDSSGGGLISSHCLSTITHLGNSTIYVNAGSFLTDCKNGTMHGIGIMRGGDFVREADGTIHEGHIVMTGGTLSYADAMDEANSETHTTYLDKFNKDCVKNGYIGTFDGTTGCITVAQNVN